jgi:hypothetical protein
VAEDPPEGRPDDEAEPERRPDQPHALGALFRRRHVRNVGQRRGEVAPRRPVNDPGHEEQGQGVRHPHQEKPGRRPQHADEQDGPAADPVGQPPQERGAEHLHRRVNPQQPADDDRRGAEPLGIKRQDRDDDAEADEVEEDDAEDDR